MAQIIFFASIREKLECDQLDHAIQEGAKVSDLINSLVAAHGESWREVLTAENNRVAVNQELVNGDAVILDSDEIAFFPPVTGG